MHPCDFHCWTLSRGVNLNDLRENQTAFSCLKTTLVTFCLPSQQTPTQVYRTVIHLKQNETQ